MTEMAVVNVNVSSKLVKRLEGYVKTTEHGVFGLLFGLHHGGKTHVFTSAMGTAGKPAEFTTAAEHFHDISNGNGFSLLGVWFKMNQGHLSVVVKQVWEKIVPKDTLKELFGDGTCLVWPVGELDLADNQMSVEGAAEPHLYRYTQEDAALTPVIMEKVTSSPLDTALLLRLRAPLTVGFHYSSKKGELRNNIVHAIWSLQESIDSDLAMFHVKDSPVLLSNHQPSYGLLTAETPCEELLNHITTDGGVVEKKGRKKGPLVQSVVPVQLLMHASGKMAADYGITCAPVIHHDHKDFKHVRVPLVLDVVVAALPEMPLSTLPKLLTEATVRQLAIMEACLLRHTEGEKFHIPHAYHFKPTCMDHICTAVYPNGVGEDKLESYRTGLHQLLCLPADQPLLRRTMAYRFPGEASPDGLLQNPHIGLAPSGVEGGQTFLVNGTYGYHHYMQDRIDDNKWGCAYRSLQTLISWLRHQGYTDKAVATHREIQQALVDIGDKDPKFVGSREWIGSTEVGYVLDHLYGVSSKILFVSNGAEMASKARELALHFENQGSPVMIGGGVLAHTILGVDFNDVTGDVKFLILDPHYTGAEDLQVIQEKGWCGWKGPNFWDQHAYYNMCMPQRNKMI